MGHYCEKFNWVNLVTRFLPPVYFLQSVSQLHKTEMLQWNYLIKNVPRDISSFLPNLEIFRHYFQGGKHMRPLQLILLSQCINQSFPTLKSPLNDLQISDKQYQLALITEMIHTASLMHDDVLDQQDTRRNSPTLRKIMSDKQSILGGDYLLAKASEELSKMNTNIVQLVASILMDLVMGELSQLNAHSIPNVLEKTKLKTASLFGKSSQAIAKLSDPKQTIIIDRNTISDAFIKYKVNTALDIGIDLTKNAFFLDQICYTFGHSLGMAFQIKDDILDSDEFLEGIINVPFILCANDQMWDDFDKIKHNDQDAIKRIEIKLKLEGIPKALEMANNYINTSRALLSVFANTQSRVGLDELCLYVVQRSK
eukprot:NODE_664_length_5412_cov_0.289855.p2 type:complete len:368 gc:universal NODE_664_length_5412_cov_0.289855:5300-4197(-)